MAKEYADEADPDTVGAVLRQARIRAGIQQHQLAAVMKISIWTLNRAEHNKRQFDMAWLPRLPPAVVEPVARFLRNQARQQFQDLRGLERRAVA